MRDALYEFKSFFRKGDMVLLVMCLTISAFGCLIIASTNNYRGFTRYVLVQIAAVGLGVLFYAIMSSLDLEAMAERRIWLMGLCLFFLALLIPFGTDFGSGNKSWLQIPLVPVSIQPAEICKIFYIIITASVMSDHQQKVSSPRSVIHIATYLILLVGANYLLSRDLGVSLIFVFIFVGMTFSGGVSLYWFLAGIGAVVAAWPFLWDRFFDNYQKLRIESLFNPAIDPQGIGVRYHLKRSLDSLTAGGMLGQGLFNGTRTQAGGILPAQHTDFIFSAIGEEMGFFGCALVLIMLFLLVMRCVWVGNRSSDFMRRMVCFGVAAALIFQIVVNVGMCIGLVPVIGLTLPLISYGGSSTVTIYAMLGLVSGVYARPSKRSHEHYIRPPR